MFNVIKPHLQGDQKKCKSFQISFDETRRYSVEANEMAK